jgi:CBS domain-containing protein
MSRAPFIKRRSKAILVSGILREKGHHILAIAAQATLLETARVLAANRINALLVLGGRESLAAIISGHNILMALSEDGPGALGLPVAARMTTNVATSEASDTVEAVMEMMTRCRFAHRRVVSDGRVVGVISTSDVFNSWMGRPTGKPRL